MNPEEKTPEIIIADLNRELKELKLENLKMQRVLEEYEIEGYTKDVSDTEAICMLQIRILLETAKIREFLPDEVKNLESLHKTLKASRGEDYGKKPRKKEKKDPKELLKILQND
jgi:hypothetical protein